MAALGGAVLAGALALAPSADAGVTTVDISSLVNGSWGQQGVAGTPTGAVTLNGTPFQIGAAQDGSADYAVMSGTETLDVNIADPTKVFTLFNSFWGQQGPASYLSVTFNGTGGATETFHLVGNEDIRDFNHYSWTNDLNGADAVNVWTDGQHRLDEQTFALSSAFRGQTLTSIVIDDTGGDNFQRGVLTGLSVQTAAVPEPAVWVMLVLGLGFVGASLRGRRQPVLAA
jgi:hypothetical protein